MLKNWGFLQSHRKYSTNSSAMPQEEEEGEEWSQIPITDSLVDWEKWAVPHGDRTGASLGSDAIRRLFHRVIETLLAECVGRSLKLKIKSMMFYRWEVVLIFYTIFFTCDFQILGVPTRLTHSEIYICDSLSVYYCNYCSLNKGYTVCWDGLVLNLIFWSIYIAKPL